MLAKRSCASLTCVRWPNSASASSKNSSTLARSQASNTCAQVLLGLADVLVDHAGEIDPVELDAERARQHLRRHRLAGAARPGEQRRDAPAHRAQPPEAPLLVDRPAQAHLRPRTPRGGAAPAAQHEVVPAVGARRAATRATRRRRAACARHASITASGPAGATAAARAMSRGQERPVEHRRRRPAGRRAATRARRAPPASAPAAARAPADGVVVGARVARTRGGWRRTDRQAGAPAARRATRRAADRRRASRARRRQAARSAIAGSPPRARPRHRRRRRAAAGVGDEQRHAAARRTAWRQRALARARRPDEPISRARRRQRRAHERRHRRQLGRVEARRHGRAAATRRIASARRGIERHAVQQAARDVRIGHPRGGDRPRAGLAVGGARESPAHERGAGLDVRRGWPHETAAAPATAWAARWSRRRGYSRTRGAATDRPRPRPSGSGDRPRRRRGRIAARSCASRSSPGGGPVRGVDRRGQRARPGSPSWNARVGVRRARRRRRGSGRPRRGEIARPSAPPASAAQRRRSQSTWRRARSRIRVMNAGSARRGRPPRRAADCGPRCSRHIHLHLQPEAEVRRLVTALHQEG